MPGGKKGKKPELDHQLNSQAWRARELGGRGCASGSVKDARLWQSNFGWPWRAKAPAS
jgi:hypothetical protein